MGTDETGRMPPLTMPSCPAISEICVVCGVAGVMDGEGTLLDHQGNLLWKGQFEQGQK